LTFFASLVEFSSKKTLFFAFFAALMHFSSAKIVFFPMVGYLPCLLPIKMRCFLAF